MEIMSILQERQLNLMLMLSGICAILAFFVAISKNLTRSRKLPLLFLELGAMFLLMFDRYAYVYRGDVSTIGYWMVRISNFAVFSLTLFCLFCFNQYLIDLYKTEGGFEKIPRRLIVAPQLLVIGEILIIISQFTGFYYTFDETNHYQRAGGFIICYIIPLAVLIIQLSFILQYYKRVSKFIRISLFLFTAVPLLASVLQIFIYGLSLTNIAIVGLTITLYIFSLLDLNDKLERSAKREIELVTKENEEIRLLFEQTASALANAIDAKDKYTHGHSRRVAEYSRKIAEYAGKSERECDEVYFSALLHDIGKIGIPDSIISKDGKLTDEEYAVIKTHPVIGNQILSSINRSPYLSIGAHYHHERYDGHGYPEHLKYEDIPDIARIIAVADAYDAMSSKRSYRDPLPQDLVREEIVKGLETQFDPEYSKIMLHLIDFDTEYDMKEHSGIKELGDYDELHCGEYRDNHSVGLIFRNSITKISLRSTPNEHDAGTDCVPTLLIFDSLDGRVHISESDRKSLQYYEYCTIRLDGNVESVGARKIKTTVKELAPVPTEDIFLNEKLSFDIEAVRFKDHLLVRFTGKYKSAEVIIALPDNTRYAYLSLTGKHCDITNVTIDRTEEAIDENYIPRIAEEVSYIDGPEGDIPNLQIDGWRFSATEGVPITDGMKLSFHTKGLPIARLVWHCPYILIFYSDDRKVNRNGTAGSYHEFSLTRFDGEYWPGCDEADVHGTVVKQMQFKGWNAWKELLKKGIDCEITFKRDGNTVTLSTYSGGLSITTRTTVNLDVPELYVSLTGDQCVLTNIRITQE